MIASINFNYQFAIRAKEIHNELTNYILEKEFMS